MAQRRYALPGEYEELRKRTPISAVTQYLAQRKREIEQPAELKAKPLAEVLLRYYSEDRAKRGDKATLSPDARAVIEAAGLKIPA